jgi:hypothetical protein
LHERSTAPFAERRGGSSTATPPFFILEAVNSIETKNELQKSTPLFYKGFAKILVLAQSFRTQEEFEYHVDQPKI